MDNILIICGGIGTIGGAVAILYKGYRHIRNPLDELSGKLDENLKRVANLEKENKKFRKLQNAKTQATLVMLDHMITNNHTGELKQERKALEQTLREVAMDD